MDKLYVLHSLDGELVKDETFVCDYGVGAAGELELYAEMGNAFIIYAPGVWKMVWRELERK